MRVLSGTRDSIVNQPRARSTVIARSSEYRIGGNIGEERKNFSLDHRMTKPVRAIVRSSTNVGIGIWVARTAKCLVNSEARRRAIGQIVERKKPCSPGDHPIACDRYIRVSE